MKGSMLRKIAQISILGGRVVTSPKALLNALGFPVRASKW